MSFTNVGTIRWMSPELFRDYGHRQTKQSDCYALGMVIYEVCENGTASLFLVVYFSTLGPLWGGSLFRHGGLFSHREGPQRWSSTETRGCEEPRVYRRVMEYG